MKRKTLKSIVLTASIMGIIGLAGCADHQDYHFDGKFVERNEQGEIIKEEQVKFYEDFSGVRNFLEVIKSDGRIIVYKDTQNNDLKIESVEITTEGKTKTYYTTLEVHKPIMEEAQKQFDEYLQKIWEHKQQEGLNNIGE